MKNLKQTIRIIGMTFFILWMMVSSNELYAQKAKPIKTTLFQILVETTDTGIKLTGMKGCAWKELTFNLEMNKPQAINQDGMATLNNTNSEGVTKNRTFLFTITKTPDGLSFEGIDGTAWKDLSFQCPLNKCFQIIDQNGMFKTN
jgi:hypothetical protein